MAGTSAATRAAAERTRRDTANRIVAVNRKLESLKGAKKQRLAQVIDWAKREFGIRSGHIIRSYIYAAHGEGAKADYHDYVKHSAGPAGRELTEKMFGYKPVVDKVFELFEEHKNRPENVPLPRDIAAQHGFGEKKVYSALKRVASHPDYRDAYDVYKRMTYEAQPDVMNPGSTEQKMGKAFRGMADTVTLRRITAGEHPDVSRVGASKLISTAAGATRHTIVRHLRAAAGEEGAGRYGKYGKIFRGYELTGAERVEKARKKVGFEAYNLMVESPSQQRMDNIVTILTNELQKLDYVHPEEVESFAQHIFDAERKSWLKSQKKG